jgi:predicted RNA-binding protein YlxR (DUF448 family)
MKTRKIPMRRCIGCREMREKRSLIRIVRSAEGVVSVDPTGRMNGRGAYLCRDMACYEKARKARALNREFSAEIPETVYEEVAAQLEAHVGK